MSNPIRSADQPPAYETIDFRHQSQEISGVSTSGGQITPIYVNCQLNLSEAVQVSWELLGERLIVQLPRGYQFSQVQVGQLQQGSQQSEKQQKRAQMLKFIDWINNVISVSSDYSPEFYQWWQTAHENEQIQWASSTPPGPGGSVNELAAQTMKNIKTACEHHHHPFDQGVFGNSFEKAVAYARKHKIAYPKDDVQLAETDGRYYVTVSDGQGYRDDNENFWIVDPWAGCQFQAGSSNPFRKDSQGPNNVNIKGTVATSYNLAQTYIDSSALSLNASSEILESVLYAASRCPGSHFYFEKDSTCSDNDKLNDFLSTIRSGMHSESVYCLGFTFEGMIHYLPLDGQTTDKHRIKMAIAFTDNDWEYWASFFQKLCPLISSIDESFIIHSIKWSVKSFNRGCPAPLKMIVVNGYLSGLKSVALNEKHRLITDLISDFHAGGLSHEESVLLIMVQAMLDNLPSNDKKAVSERLRPLVKSIIFDRFANSTECVSWWGNLEDPSIERLMQLSMLVNDHYDDFTREFQNGLNKLVQDADKREKILEGWIRKAQEAECQPLVENLNKLKSGQVFPDFRFPMKRKFGQIA
ncbi:hypothetical protein [Endozoicomonas ascidiicola]|uniref:hypothetical protein n=1 Tax=Endozoicomonas ascidiicola TaxID=1698521 RepID=UPI000833A7F8|nr:hypothetical protein [Endozoicomonas ascidiicola]